MNSESDATLRDALRALQDAGWDEVPTDEDALLDNLLQSNPAFQAKVAQSKEGPRKPFTFGRGGG